MRVKIGWLCRADRDRLSEYILGLRKRGYDARYDAIRGRGAFCVSFRESTLIGAGICAVFIPRVKYRLFRIYFCEGELEKMCEGYDALLEICAYHVRGVRVIRDGANYTCGICGNVVGDSKGSCRLDRCIQCEVKQDWRGL